MVSCRLGKLIVQWVVSDCHTCGRTITVPREFSRLHWACTESIVASSYTLATVFCDVTTNNNNTKRNHTHKQRIQLNTHHQPCSPYSVNNHCNSQWYFGSLEVPTKLSVRLISQLQFGSLLFPLAFRVYHYVRTSANNFGHPQKDVQRIDQNRNTRNSFEQMRTRVELDEHFLNLMKPTSHRTHHVCLYTIRRLFGSKVLGPACFSLVCICVRIHSC